MKLVMYVQVSILVCIKYIHV